MPSPIALTTPPRQESIFKKRSPSYLTAMRSAQSYLIALSEADARARSRDSASTMSTPALSLSSSATTLSEEEVINDAPCDNNSDGLAFPTTPPTSEQFASANHLQFGFCANENYRYRSAHKPGTQLKVLHEQDPPYYILLTTYLGYLFLICIGHLRDFFGKRLYPSFYRHLLPFDVSLFRSIVRVFSAYSSPRVMLPLIRILTPFTPDGSKHASMTVSPRRSLASLDEQSLSSTVTLTITTIPFSLRERRRVLSTFRLTTTLALLPLKVDVQTQLRRAFVVTASLLVVPVSKVALRRCTRPQKPWLLVSLATRMLSFPRWVLRPTPRSFPPSSPRGALSSLTS